MKHEFLGLIQKLLIRWDHTTSTSFRIKKRIIKINTGSISRVKSLRQHIKKTVELRTSSFFWNWLKGLLDYYWLIYDKNYQNAYYIIILGDKTDWEEICDIQTASPMTGKEKRARSDKLSLFLTEPCWPRSSVCRSRPPTRKTY